MSTTNSADSAVTPGFAKFTYTAGVLTGGVDYTNAKGPYDEAKATKISLGTYKADGTALAVPDAAKWTNLVPDANAYWAEEGTTSYYYNSVIDSAADSFNGKYNSSLAAKGIFTFYKKGKEPAADTSVADTIALGAWKI